MAERDLPPVPYKVKLLDSQGYVSQAWAAWLRQLFFRVGGHDAKTNLELDLGSADSITTEMIVNDAVTNPKLGNMPSQTIKGRNSAGTGDPQDLTATQVTAMLGIFTALLKGLVPPSGGGTDNFLRADGEWEPPIPPDGSITTPKLAPEAVTPEKVSGAGATTGQVLKYDGSSVVWADSAASAGAGGELLGDGNGNNEINISPRATLLVIADSSTAKWYVKVGNDGALYTESGASEDETTPFKIQKPDLSYGQIGVGTDGTLFVDDTPAASAIDNHCYLQSADLSLFKLAITNLNEIQTIEDVGDGARLSVVSNDGTVLWQLRSLPGYIALQYLRVLSAADILVGTPPPVVSGCLPYAFYDNGSNKRLVYHDGSAWKYVHDNSAV